MNTIAVKSHVRAVLASLVLLSGAGPALTAQPSSGAPETPSREAREKMAATYEQLAACLRSDKPFAECHKEAMKQHQGMMGKDGCPMMGTDHAAPKESGNQTQHP